MVNEWCCQRDQLIASCVWRRGNRPCKAFSTLRMPDNGNYRAWASSSSCVRCGGKEPPLRMAAQGTHVSDGKHCQELLVCMLRATRPELPHDTQDQVFSKNLSTSNACTLQIKSAGPSSAGLRCHGAAPPLRWSDHPWIQSPLSLAGRPSSRCRAGTTIDGKAGVTSSSGPIFREHKEVLA